MLTSNRHRPFAVLGMLGVVAALGTGGITIARAAGAGTPSNIVPVAPERVLDTRLGIGQPAVGPVGPGQTITLQVAGVGSVPANATGVVLNITATRATAASFVTAWPTGATKPTSSILNFQPGADIANMITATLGDNGSLNLFNSAGTVDLIADVAGFLTAGSQQSGSLVIDQLVSSGTIPDVIGTAAGFKLVAGCASAGSSGFQSSLRAADDSVVSFRGTLTKGTSTSVRASDDEAFVALIDTAGSFLPQVLEGLISAPGGVVAHVTLTVSGGPGGSCHFWAQFDPATRATGL